MSTRRRRFPTRSAPSISPNSGAASVDDARHRHDLTGRLRNAVSALAAVVGPAANGLGVVVEGLELSRQIVVVVDAF
jgi:hypothetical protein